MKKLIIGSKIMTISLCTWIVLSVATLFIEVFCVIKGVTHSAFISDIFIAIYACGFFVLPYAYIFRKYVSEHWNRLLPNNTDPFIVEMIMSGCWWKAEEKWKETNV